MSVHSNRSIVNRWTFIGLAVATVAFFFAGNQGGGKNGNVFIIGVPICLVLLLVLGAVALMRWRSSRHSGQSPDPASPRQPESGISIDAGLKR